jgi:hypothetical protein
MKKTWLFLTLASLALIRPLCASDLTIPRLIISPKDGSVFRQAGTSIKVIEWTPKKLVLECSRESNLLSLPKDANFSAWKPGDLWREIWVVSDGKLVLDHIIEPRIIPARSSSIEWDVQN